MDQICELPRWSDVDAALDHVPQGVDQMIQHVFERLNANESVSKKDLNTLLIWVTLAKRPLLMGELNTILSLPPNKGHYMGLIEHMKTRFASLFKLLREDTDGLNDDEGTADPVDTMDIKASAETVEQDCNGNRPDRSENAEDEDSEDTDSSQANSEDSDDSSEVNEKTMKVFESTRVEYSHVRIKELLLQVSSRNSYLLRRKLKTSISRRVGQKRAHGLKAILVLISMKPNSKSP